MTDSRLAACVDRTERCVGDIVDAVVAAILNEIAIYRDGVVVPRTDLRRSVSDNVRYILSALRDPESGRDFVAPRETGRRRAQQGVPLPEVIRAFRLCFTGVWDQLATELRRADEPDMIDTVLTATSAIWQLTDEYALALTEAHRSTTAELLVERQQRRSALAEALFSGEPGPESWPWEISALLGLPADSDLVVVAAETVRPAQEGLPNIEKRLVEHGFTSIWQLTPARQRGIVALSGGTLDSLMEILRQVARTRTGVSPAFRSLRETPRALHLAGVAAASGTPGAVTALSASPLAGLVAEHPDESWRLAREVLGRVLELPADDRAALLGTAQAWFDHGGSAERAGEALYCHPNTVRYRLRRLQELTGRTLTQPWAVAELAAALQSYTLQRTRLDRPTPS